MFTFIRYLHKLSFSLPSSFVSHVLLLCSLYFRTSYLREPCGLLPSTIFENCTHLFCSSWSSLSSVYLLTDPCVSSSCNIFFLWSLYFFLIWRTFILGTLSFPKCLYSSFLTKHSYSLVNGYMRRSEQSVISLEDRIE